MTSEDQTRRLGDRDQMLNGRLDSMEREHQLLRVQVTALESKLNIVQLEQTHLKDLFDARLKVIEKAMEMQLAETKAISVAIQAMGSDPDRTPAGRIIQAEIKSIFASLDETKETINSHIKIHTDLKDWQTRVDSILSVLKWIGAGGLTALGITVLRMLKLLP